LTSPDATAATLSWQEDITSMQDQPLSKDAGSQLSASADLRDCRLGGPSSTVVVTQEMQQKKYWYLNVLPLSAANYIITFSFRFPFHISSKLRSIVC